MNAVVITRADLEARLAQSRSMNPARYDALGAEERARAVRRTLDGMIERELLVQEAERLGLAIPAVRVAALLDAAGGQALTGRLAEHGISMDQWREETRRNLLIDDLEARSASALPVTDSDTRRFLALGASDPLPPETAGKARVQLQRLRWVKARAAWIAGLRAGAVIDIVSPAMLSSATK